MTTTTVWTKVIYFMSDKKHHDLFKTTMMFLFLFSFVF
ncbi:hypothetical protein SMSK321_0595 [Streptococcus mitis SK321]|nr:hypothetical protein SMSK321_0595 [Streptococcus mitis SK321]